MALLYDRDVPTAQKIRDVSTELMYLKAEHTPVLSAIPKGSKPKASLVEFPFRARHAAAENAVEDGVDVVNGDLINNSANKNMLYARTQQLRRAVGVSKRAQLLATEYTAKDQYADNLMDVMIVIKEDAERMILRDVDSVPGSSGVAEKTRGLLKWIKTTAGSDLPVPTAALCAAGNIVSGRATASVVTEDDFRGVLETMATLSRSGGRNIVAYVSPAMKTAFSNFTRTGTISATTTALRRFDQQPGKLTLNCTMYEGDFGNVLIVPHFALADIESTVHAILVNHDEWKLRPAQNFQHEKLPFEGGIHKGYIDAFLCLQVDNPQAFGKITT